MEFKLNEYHRNISDEELLKDVLKVAKALGKESITTKEYVDNGGLYHSSTIQRRFNGWVNALQKCGLNPDKKQTSVSGVSTTDMISDLKRVADSISKKTITTSEYTQYGQYSIDIFLRKYGSWNSALKAADLVPFDHPLGGGTKNRVSEYACLEEIERIWIMLGRQPTTTDIKNGISKYSLHTFERRFGSWRKALEFFVSYMNGEQEVEKTDKIDDDIQLSDDIQDRIENEMPRHKTKRDINLRMRFLVMKRDNFKCCMCGRSPATTPGLELHIDHIVPWSKGGETVIDNLQTLCSDCNLGKSNLSETE